MNIIIFDINKSFVSEAIRLEKYGIKVINIDAETLINNHKIDFIVSPANSFGFMNGGIDKIYRNIFPNIQKTVQNKIKRIGLTTNSGRYYLPIGSAITVPTFNVKCNKLICAPTMFLPGNIQRTNNVKYCFMAIMFIANNNLNNTVAVPGLGTGIGMLNPKYCIDQMEDAIKNYNTLLKNCNNLIKHAHSDNIILNKTICPQSNNYANRELP